MTVFAKITGFTDPNLFFFLFDSLRRVFLWFLRIFLPVELHLVEFSEAFSILSKAISIAIMFNQ